MKARQTAKGQTTPKRGTAASIRTGSAQEATNGARTETGNADSHRANAQKPHRRTKRHEPEQIHTNSIKRHTARNYKAADKRRTKTAEEPRNVKYI